MTVSTKASPPAGNTRHRQWVEIQSHQRRSGPLETKPNSLPDSV
jgi:hypothetical protein